MSKNLETYVQTKSAKIVGGTDPSKRKSLSQQISFGTGKNNKQSPGFFDMIVKTIKKVMD